MSKQGWMLVLLLILAAGCRPKPVEEIKSTVAESTQADPIDVPENSWPWWRGLNRDNITPNAISNVQWSNTPNVAWSAKVSGLGHSTPIVLNDRILLTTADEKAETKSLICYDRKTGKPSWTTQIHQGGFVNIHQKNSQASATPATDGNLVYTAFVVKDGLYVTAVDLNGKIVWQEEAGDFHSQHGFGSSPILFESLVIVVADTAGTGFVAAMHRDSGEIVWRISRPSDNSYSTPLLVDIGGQPQLIINAQNKVVSYDPKTGEELWSERGPAKTVANSVSYAGDVVVATGGYPSDGVMAYRVSGSETDLSAELLWEAKDRIYVPTPLITDGKLLAVNDKGIGLAYDLKTGDRLAKKRIGGDFSSSLTRYGDHMLVPDEDGTMHVFMADESFEEVATFTLPGEGFASPVFSQGQLFWRTSSHLHCITLEEGPSVTDSAANP